MALLSVEGFDDGLAAARWPYLAGVVDAAYGKNGKGMRVGDLYSDMWFVEYDSLTADTTLTFGAWIRIVTDGGTGTILLCGFTADAAGQWLLSYYNVRVMRDTLANRWGVQDRTGTVWGSNGGCQLNTWYYVELQATIADGSGGSWEFHVDGVTTLSASSRDTYLSGGGNVVFGGLATSEVDGMYVDDFYLVDSTGSVNNDFLGICRVETLLPDGNGNSSVLVGSDADSTNNYLLVDNNAAVPPATTEYVESDTEGDKDTYTMDDLSGTADVYGLQTTLYAKKDDSGAKFARPVVRSGGTDYPGTSRALVDSTYVPFDEIWETDPGTSSLWAYTAVNGAEVGPEIRDS